MIKQVWINPRNLNAQIVSPGTVDKIKQLEDEDLRTELLGLFAEDSKQTSSMGYAWDDGAENFDGTVPLLLGTNKAGDVTRDKKNNVVLNIKHEWGKKKGDHAANEPSVQAEAKPQAQGVVVRRTAQVQLQEDEDTIPGPHVEEYDYDPAEGAPV